MSLRFASLKVGTYVVLRSLRFTRILGPRVSVYASSRILNNALFVLMTTKIKSIFFSVALDPTCTLKRFQRSANDKNTVTHV